MGKSSATKLQQFARFVATNTSKKPIRPTQLRPVSKAKPISSSDPTGHNKPEPIKVRTRQLEPVMAENLERLPLAEVVSDCVKRWFQDTLKEAKAGDTSMQVLVGQMYYSGYGVVRDDQKGRAWINRASRNRSSVWKVGEKHPGYNASDSDSDTVKEEVK